MHTADAILSVLDLRVGFGASDHYTEVVKGVSFSLERGEVLGWVGESGSGKTQMSLALLQLTDPAARVAGQVFFRSLSAAPVDLLSLDIHAIRKYRGRKISFIFQEPQRALNPVLTCGWQIKEALENHSLALGKTAEQTALGWLDRVGLPDVRRIYSSYPHQLSGGQLQRVMIAMALCTEPELLIADEPTTALDLRVQQHLLDLLLDLKQELGLSMLFVSHDLGVIADIADRTVVMEAGKLVETQQTATLFSSPQHTCTKKLLSSRPPLQEKLYRLPLEGYKVSPENLHLEKDLGVLTQPVMEVQNLVIRFGEATWWAKQTPVKAVDQVSFELFAGETLGLAGASGSGKTTIGKSMVRLVTPQSGKILFKGRAIFSLKGADSDRYFKSVQYIFQNPYLALNPTMEAGESIREVIARWNPDLPYPAQKKAALEYLEQVGLNASHYHRYPAAFSGGQRQRICIARALAAEPEVLICDEVVSSLDVSVQAQVLNLLKDLQATYNLTLLFITHDMAVMRFMADRLAILNDGKIIEIGLAEQIFNQPAHNYTKEMLEAVPGKNI